MCIRDSQNQARAGRISRFPTGLGRGPTHPTAPRTKVGCALWPPPELSNEAGAPRMSADGA
eukprot:9225745-Alexandrium_andersonii.AAC.1